MDLCSRLISFGRVFLFLAILIPALISPSMAQIPELILFMSDSLTGCPGETEKLINVYMVNYFEEVSGFDLMLAFDRPDAMVFQGSIDTAGTLISGWEYIDVHLMTEYGLMISVRAENNSPPYTYGIQPQNGDIPLFKIPVDVLSPQDPYNDGQVSIIFNGPTPCFISPGGYCIALIPAEDIDTTYYSCLYWADPPDNTICLFYERVYEPPYDSMAVDTTVYYVVDPELVITEALWMEIYPELVGDYNGDGKYNLTDILLNIGVLYGDVLPIDPPPMIYRDFSCDCSNALDDILDLISYLYVVPIGQPYTCSCLEWRSKCD